jgi:protein O-mannosyl-transferase
MEKARDRRADVLLPLVLASAVLAVFWPALGHGFINLDDPVNFLKNPHYRGLGPENLKWMWTTTLGAHYIPVTWMSFGLDHLLWGMDPAGYHLTNVLLHAANAALVYFLLARLLGPGSALAAAFGALFFALHPLRVESVAWVTERRDVLSGVFFFSSLLAYLKSAAPGGKTAWGPYAASLLLFALAVLSKESAVPLPAALLLLDVYVLGRFGRGLFGPGAGRVWLEKAPFFAVSAAGAAAVLHATASLGRYGDLLTAYDRIDPAARLIKAAFPPSFLAWKTAVPVGLSPLYELPLSLSLREPRLLLAVTAFLGGTTALFALRRRAPAVWAGWLYCLALLSPMMGIADAPVLAADRNSYLPSLAFSLGAAGLFLKFWSRGSARARAFAGAGALAAAACLGTLARTQTALWKDPATLWTHAVRLDPAGSLARLYLGKTRQDEGRLAEAEELYRASLAIRPNNAYANTHLGALLVSRGRADEAAPHFERALAVLPGYADAAFALANIRLSRGKPAEAEALYRTVLRTMPGFAHARANLGLALASQGKTAEAEAEYAASLRLAPLPETHNNYARLLASQRRYEAALQHYEAALRLRPDHVPTLTNAGALLLAAGRAAEAKEVFRKVLRLDPGNAAARDYLAKMR